MIDLFRKAARRLYTYSVPRRLSTSLSDNQAYPHICARASRDYRAFNTFRRNPIYNQILEHVTPQEGEKYLDEIRKDPEIFGLLTEFKHNDQFGGPRLAGYPTIGKVSPSTLRYVKVLADLRRLFGSLRHQSLCEIGVGYGGQCRVIDAYFQPSGYRLVDIRPALALALRFLDHFVLHAVLSARTMNELEEADYDLVISNYAFTELPRRIQDVYMAKVISRSRRGYITYNEVTPPYFESYDSSALLQAIPGARIIPEVPLTHPTNCIIVWGDLSA